ncbi:hypothetical protein ALO61_200047 [Pseudomonas savastanoi pv. nerii]|nr:hypothetical protein ALO61_200047 [Pseudomonas savastanoi pv. nerii]KUG40786.1 hypothetical protein ALP79_200228 [Pseudomonas savastanoi pv. fraxini]RML24967.1 hypothetical protein ALR00_200098 [Pseudomonas savastanoi pv. retacarpa]RML75562.1 hypothetical protein ALQ90_200071 [Pseudomonas savastanoi pv. savastanoi]RML96081.1 hypothetical protein ALQ88_200094 [Pseudomonas savastanoi]
MIETALPCPAMASASLQAVEATAWGTSTRSTATNRGWLFHTRLSDQLAPFSARMFKVGVRDATYALDGLLYHESDLLTE